MRHFPEDEDDLKDAADLNAEDWQMNLLKLNPEYTWWGPYEDYMCSGIKKVRFSTDLMGNAVTIPRSADEIKKDYGNGWREPYFADSWQEFGWELDELNECVNFYFQVDRESKECAECDRSGYNPEMKQISDDWYDFAGTGRRWCDNITQDEVQALVDERRLTELTHDSHKSWANQDPPKVPTAEEVNAWAKKRPGLGHDAINQWICVKARGIRLGVFGDDGRCTTCKGKGYVHTAPAAHVNLVLWMIHPRKGCSRGAEVKNIQRNDLPEIFQFLKEAADRNANRFAKALEQA